MRQFGGPGEMLEMMIQIATKAHAGQLDQGGMPYILHPLTVMHTLHTDDEELMCIAIGHDMVEDTDVTFQELRDLGFTERVIQGINDLSKRRGETLAEYKTRVKSNKDAILVKREDLRHNSDIRRLRGVKQRDIDRMIRYHEFWVELNDALEYIKMCECQPTAG